MLYLKKIPLLVFLTFCFACSSKEKKNESPPPLSLDVSQDIVNPRQYIIAKTQEPLQIDGEATEKAWLAAPFSESFIDIEGVKKVAFDTKVKMLWDDQFLYVYARLEEPHIWGNLQKRDTVIFFNNDFEVFMDPSGVGQNYGEIEINALGTVWDLLLDKAYRVGGKAQNHWTLPKLKTAVKINGTLNNPQDIDSLWSVEMAIPMQALLALKNTPQTLPTEGEQWRLNFSRVQWDYELANGAYRRKKVNGKLQREYNWVWSNQKVINMHEPEKWGVVQFTQQSSPKGIPFIRDTLMPTKQVIYALFRQTRYGKLNKLLKIRPGTTQTIQATFGTNRSLSAVFYKTHAGFEYVAIDAGTKFIINEEGSLKTIIQ